MGLTGILVFERNLNQASTLGIKSEIIVQMPWCTAMMPTRPQCSIPRECIAISVSQHSCSNDIVDLLAALEENQLYISLCTLYMCIYPLFVCVGEYHSQLSIFVMMPTPPQCSFSRECIAISDSRPVTPVADRFVIPLGLEPRMDSIEA